MRPSPVDPTAIVQQSGSGAAIPLPLGSEADDAPEVVGPWWQKLPAVPMALSAALLAFLLVPPVRGNPGLVRAFSWMAAGLFVWELILWATVRRQGRLLRIEYVPVKSHYVQACVQFSIMLYWGLYWPQVFPELPLILGQVVYLYALDALLSWSRGRTWRLGYGPLPIVVSTNLLLWFKHDWYIFQFLMLTTGALAKQFITWNRDGKRTHIFNPSAFGQFLFALALIGTGTTKQYTWGSEIAASFDPPHMLLVIFLGGLVVQFLFHVTLMTVAATATLAVLNLIYFEVTGTYLFVSINIAGPIFLGMHLLLTDPATSPRTNIGRVVFGVLYAIGYTVLFRVLDVMEVPIFWDKLLPVPILNLMVPMIDRVVRSGFIGTMNRAWEGALPRPRLNLVHMACWAGLFFTMLGTGFIESPHPGNSIPFWKKAFIDGKPFAGHSLVMTAGGQAEGGGSGAAFNELGLICMEGKIVNENHGLAARYFSQACALEDESGCVNVAIQYLFLDERLSDEDVARALDLLEKDCMNGGNDRSCYLVGFAHEVGRGRPLDQERALAFYEAAGPDNLYAARGVARVGLTGVPPLADVKPWVRALADAAQRGDVESYWYLAYMYRDGVWLRQDMQKARDVMQRACDAGSAKACEALKTPDLPPYVIPTVFVPGWATAYPVE